VKKLPIGIQTFEKLIRSNYCYVDFSAICGYTQRELEMVFADRLLGVDLDRLRWWYNGYNWLGEEVYNPFDILLYLKTKEFRPYWFETGTPGFLVELLRDGRYNIPEMERMSAGEEIVGSFDVENISAETLLFQTGYLTIESFEQIEAFRHYSLAYPNMEVKSSLANAILNGLLQDRLAKTRNQSALLDALQANDLDGMRRVFHRFFASVPHERSYVIELKVVELTDAGGALEQIKARGYADGLAGEVCLIGVEFSREARNIVRFEWERRS